MLKTAMFFINVLVLVIDSGKGLKTGSMIQKQSSTREDDFLKPALGNVPLRKEGTSLYD